MKAILIDPAVETITEVDIDRRDFAAMARLLGCATLDFAYLRGGDMVAVDDVGILEPRGRPCFFLPGLYGGWLVGRGLVLGTDPEGNTRPPRVTVAGLAGVIQYGPRHPDSPP